MVIENLCQLASLMSGKQKEYYDRMIKDARLVKIYRLQEIFSDEEIECIKLKYKPEIKACYKNATLFSTLCLSYNVEYVEGFIDVQGLLVEHAWNKIDDKYVDITLELALQTSPIIEHVAIGEYNKDIVLNHITNTNVYGGIYETLNN